MSSNDMPVFDLNITRRWSKKFAKSWERATRLQNRLSRVPTPDMSPEERNKFYDLQEAALDEIEGLADEQTAMVAEALVSVPADWLESDAPADLDWDDVESFDYILQSKYGELVQMLIDGSAFRDSAKN